MNKSVTQAARGSMKSWSSIWLISLVAFLLLSGNGRAGADQLQNLNNTLDNLGNEVDTTTAVEQEAGSVITQTNATQCGLLIGTIQMAHAGDTIVYPVSFLPGPNPIAALQADVLLSSGISILSVGAGPAAIAAGKTVSFSGNPSNPMIVFGLNQTPIGRGVLLQITLKIDSSIGPGLFPIVFTNPVASDPLGGSKPICETSGILEVS